jgi:hypothetical protein
MHRFGIRAENALRGVFLLFDESMVSDPTTGEVLSRYLLNIDRGYGPATKPLRGWPRTAIIAP